MRRSVGSATVRWSARRARPILLPCFVVVRLAACRADNHAAAVFGGVLADLRTCWINFHRTVDVRRGLRIVSGWTLFLLPF